MTSPPDRPKRAPRPCPICARMSVLEFHPFCSDRCRKIDLHRWLTGQYAIPVVETDDEDDEARGG